MPGHEFVYAFICLSNVSCWLFAADWPCPSYFRCTLNMQHSGGDVGFRVVLVRFTPRSGRAGTVAFSSLLTHCGSRASPTLGIINVVQYHRNNLATSCYRGHRWSGD